MGTLTLDEYLKKKKEEEDNKIIQSTNKTTSDTIKTLDEYLRSKASTDNVLTLNEYLSKNKTTTTTTTSNNNANQEWYDGIFKSGAYADGYQAGDFLKTVGSSIGDVGVNLVKGAGGLVEGVGDLVTYGAADVAGFFGNETWANQARENAKKSTVDAIFNPLETALDKNSVFDTKADEVVKGLGYVAAITAVGALTGGAGAALGASGATAATVGTTATTFVSAMGNNMSEALNDGATLEEARVYGVISGLAEAGSELMFGGLGKASEAFGLSKGALDDVLVGGLTKNIKHKLTKTIVQSGLKAGGEGFEEFVSGFVSGMAKRYTYMKQGDNFFEKVADTWKNENLAEQFWMGAITSALAQAPSTIVSGYRGTDYLTGRTENEQKVYDSELNTRKETKVKEATIEKAYNEQIKAQENLGVKLTEEAKAEIRQKVENAYENGTIENIELSKKELNAIEEQLDTDMQEGNISEEGIRKALGENFNVDKKKDKMLMRSMYENAQKYEDFQYEKTDNEKVNTLMQSAVDAGMNNTSKTRKKVQLIAKLTQDTDRQYKFVSPEQLKEMGYNENANGLINKSTGEILINYKNGEGTQFVVGHETTHIFDSKDADGKYSTEYQELQKAIFEYAKVKGVYDARLQSVTDAYKQQLLSETEIKEELTADLVGEFLFNDEAFIEQLSVKNKNIFQKIYDYIKHAYTMAKGTDEEKAFEELKSKFEKVYKTVDKTTKQVAKEGPQYSLSDIEEKYKDKTKYLILSEHEKTNTISINNMVVKEELRNQGIGQSILNDVIEYANKNNKVITLTPTTEFNTQNRLKKWYKANGFVENKGKNTDFLISDTMYKLPDTKVQYSLTDNQGRKLSKEQQEYFKDSKVRDENGNLLTMYHGSPNKFTIFDKTLNNEDNVLGQGFYFTEDWGAAQHYSTKQGKLKDGNVYETYLNITNPFVIDDLTTEALAEKIQEIDENADIIDYDYGVASTAKMTNYLISKGYDGIKAGYETYVVFDSNQIKNVDNTKPTSNPDIRYSLTQDGEMVDNTTNEVVKLEASETGTHGTLMAIHNLTESKLKGVLELGGFPVPSIAITNKVQEGFGDISVIFDKTTIDPSNKLNEVYDRDVWSPRVPITVNKFASNIGNVATNLGLKEYQLRQYLEDNTIEVATERLLREDKVIDKFLEDSNIQVEQVENVYKNKEPKAIYHKIPEIQNFVKENDVTYQKLMEDVNLRENYLKVLKDWAREKYKNTPFKSKLVDGLPPYLVSLEEQINKDAESGYYEEDLYVQSLNEDFNNMKNPEQELDEYATKNAQQRAKNSKVEEYKTEFENYIREQLETINEGKYFKKEGVDPYTDNGRKSFSQLHTKYTLENLVKAMKKQSTIAGESMGTPGFGEIQATMAKKFTSIEDIKANESQIVPRTQEEESVNSFKDTIWNDINEISKGYKYYNPNADSFDYNNQHGADNASQSLFDLANSKKITLENFKNILNENLIDSTKISDKLLLKTINDLLELKNIPTEYFEAKPQRAIGFNEVQAVVIPNNTDAKLKQQLSDRGLNVIEYDSSIEGDRQSKIDALDEYKFSLSKDNTITGDDIALRDMLKQERPTIEDEIGPAEAPTVEATNQESNTDKYNRYKQNILKARETEINNLIKEKNNTIREIEEQIASKEKLLSSKKDQTTKVANDLKMQIENLKQRKSKIENEYNSKIDRKNEKVTKDRIDVETKKQLKLTRKEVKKKLLDEMGITEKDIAVGEDISSFNFQITDPVRANEKVFGKEIGTKINDATVNKTKHNTAEKIRWQNQERKEIKDLGIKARSKESAAVQKYGEKKYVDENGNIQKYGDVELAKEFSDVAVQEKIKNAARVIRTKYDAFLEQANNVLTGLGYNPIPKREDYMRHFQELTDKFSQVGIPLNLNDMKADDLPTDINGLTAFNQPGKNWFASALQRTGEKTVYDAITGIDGYIEGVGNLIYHTGDIQNYRALSSMIRDTYGQKHGLDNIENMTEAEREKRIKDVQNNKLSKYVAWLDEQANSLAGKKGFIDRGFETMFGRKIYNVMNTAKKQVGSNMTGFNVRSSLTNLISTTLAASKTNKVAFAQGTMSTINNMFKQDDFIDKSDFLTSRFGSDTLSKKFWQKASNVGQIFMTGTDWFTSNIIVRSKYYEGLSKNMTESEAIKYADDFAARVMGDRSQGATSEIFNSKTLGLLTQFQLEVNNQWQFMVHDTKMDYQENSEANSGLKAGATAIFQIGQLAAYSYFFNELFEQLTGSRAAFDPIEIIKTLFGFDDDDDEEKTFDERLSEAGKLLVDNIPFANLFTDGGRIPVSEAFTGASTLLKKVTGGTDEYGNAITWKDVKDDTLATLPYWVMPTGYSQLKKTVKGISMYSNEVPGSYTDSGNLRYTVEEDVGSKVQAALFGAYANPYAQDYIDSGYKTINKDNIEEMVGLDMNSTEYRKFKGNLSKASSTSDKNGYKQYIDENDNIYWYDSDTETMYDSNYKKTTLTEDDLTKVSKKEEALNYIDSLDLTDAQKNLVANNLNKDSKKKIDMSEYSNYSSYDEYKYARDYPDKYSVVSQIDDYDNYETYRKQISDIKEQYSTELGYESKERKAAIEEYIETLPLNIAQKVMLYKMAGGYSIKNYKNYMYEYLESLPISKEEKYTMWEELFN